ncbi:hypothetical protein Hypma_005735 [Hypsizygus marmoreus]|uniref:Uncharacterized protein n=1 Tax=Hypsizygus marmoreus TaxID=39966 RepID=A0A369KDM8_HYPMA|nr:hypothetical protein Hypma_005735 [Hypsizygus marmoreus]
MEIDPSALSAKRPPTSPPRGEPTSKKTAHDQNVIEQAAFVIKTFVRTSISKGNRHGIKKVYEDLETCQALCVHHPELLDFVEASNILAILQHESLKKDPPPIRLSLSQGPPPESEHEPSLQDHVKAWKDPYQGAWSNLFVRALDDINHKRPRGEDYSNFLPIVQSSGTGKSRLVDEAAKEIFVIPFNLRPAGDRTGYPNPDVSVRDFLTKMNDAGQNYYYLQMRYLIFFKNLFKMVDEEVGKMEKQPTRAALASAWRDKLLTPRFRDELYSKACEASNSEIATINSVVTLGDDGLDTFCEKARNASILLVLTIARKSSSTYINTMGREDLRSVEALDGKKIKPLQLMIYFDEWHPLLDLVTLQIPASLNNAARPARTAYQVLCKTFNNFREGPVLVVYLSTNFSLSKYAPPEHMFSAARDRQGPVSTYILQAPYVELPFDLDEAAMVEEDKIQLKTVATVEHLAKFGRPLFWTRWKCASDNTKRDFVRFAGAKLYGADLPRGTDSSEDHGLLAVASVRLLIEFETQRKEAKDLESTLVESHMRITFSIPQHRQFLCSGTPSEPLLAEGAGYMLDLIKDKEGVTLADLLLRLLLKKLESGLISKGERGELIARLLLTLTHDACVERSNLETPGEDIMGNFSRPIPLVKFLQELVGKKHINKVLDARPDNIPNGATLREAFCDAQINFTHFAKGGDSSIITDEAAWTALARCIAWQCANGQDMIDLYIPILLFDAFLGRYVVSGIFIQVKNRLRKQRVEIDIEKLGFFSSGGTEEARKRPYIALIMELGIKKTKAQDRIPLLTPSKVVAKPGPTKKQPTRNSKASTIIKHPRYAISIVGCSNTVYNVVRPQDRPSYQSLLAMNGILEEHPRKDKSHWNAVLRMKPYWIKSAHSFHWARTTEQQLEQANDEAMDEEDDSDDEDIFVSQVGYDELDGGREDRDVFQG